MPSLTKLVGRTLTALPGGRALLRRAAGADTAQSAAIFMLHRVLPDPSACYDPEMVVSLAVFEAFLAWVASVYEIVPLGELPQRLARAAPGAGRPLGALTFDDGWSDTYTHAFPVLQRLRLTATVFLPLAFIGSQRRFWQERLYFGVRRLQALNAGTDAGTERLRSTAAAFPWCPDLTAADLDFRRLRARLVRRSSPEAEAFVRRLNAGLQLPEVDGSGGPGFMNWEEVRQMRAAGIDFGSHTVDHTLLSWAEPAAAGEELVRARAELEERLGVAATLLSYPWGALSPFTRAQAQAAGYTCAVTTRPGLVHAGTDVLRLPRLAISDAQLGQAPALAGAVHRSEFRPATLQVHLARARRLRPTAAPANRVPGAQPLRLGIMVDNPEAWGSPPQGQLGGSELQLLRLIEALDPRFFRPELYFLRPPASGLPRGLPWPVFGSPTASRGRLATIRQYSRLLRQHRPDIVQSMFVDGIFLGVPAARLAGIPAILCARRNAGYWKRWYHRAALPLVNRMADAWQANSILVHRMLEDDERIAPEAIEIVPNWIDLAHFHPAGGAARQAARHALGLAESDFVVVCVANYSPVKELGTLVAAAAATGERLPGLRLLLVGEGPERAGLEQAIAAQGLEARVRLAGESDRVAAYLAAADAGVLASRSEGCSNAVLEYMAAGLPTVLSDIPANRALADAGFFRVGDAAGLGAEWVRLAHDPDLRQQRGRENRRRAEAYGGDAFAARVQGHYLRAAATGRRAG